MLYTDWHVYWAIMIIDDGNIESLLSSRMNNRRGVRSSHEFFWNGMINPVFWFQCISVLSNIRYTLLTTTADWDIWLFIMLLRSDRGGWLYILINDSRREGLYWGWGRSCELFQSIEIWATDWGIMRMRTSNRIFTSGLFKSRSQTVYGVAWSIG